eukprot:COSAG02_NODE_1100_length_14582_cov_130.690672_3_plen_81_part_00
MDLSETGAEFGSCGDRWEGKRTKEMQNRPEVRSTCNELYSLLFVLHSFSIGYMYSNTALTQQRAHQRFSVFLRGSQIFSR